MNERMALTGGGWLTIKEEGSRVRLEVQRTDDGRGLYKVWLLGPEGGRFLLGTLVPEGDELHLMRQLSRSSLTQAGCWPVRGGECVLAMAFDRGAAQPGWQMEEHPERLVRDEVLRRAAFGARMMLYRQADGFRLAARFDTGRPFPLTPLFCFAHIGRLQGQPYVIFSFDGEGNPIPPHDLGEVGDNKQAIQTAAGGKKEEVLCPYSPQRS